ncbi:sigma-70 family RNA polymerase sigma factor [Streptomyces sp. NPDC089922]|uniref:RNA polymerase sigma factor n=1 Tax=Streptomyces sp. NPDC089922 TaxID=3155189 RepID=UPI00343C051B
MTESPLTASKAASQQRQAPARALRDDFDTLYIAEMRALTVHLMYRGATPYEAADAAHEAFIELLPDRWRTMTHPRAYLRTVAWTKYLRQPGHRESPSDQVPDRPGGTCPVREVILTESQDRVLAAVQQLSPAQQEVIAWQLDGFDYAEIASFTGKKETALRTNAKRGRERLKELLDLARTGRVEGGASHE